MTLALLGSFLFSSAPSGNVPLIVAVVVGGMYWLGGCQYRVARARGAISQDRVVKQRWRDVSFHLGLLILVFSLQEPVDHYADRLFWMHMVQHVLLISVVAPLIVLGAPWMRVWRGLPLSARRPLARWAVRGRTGAPLRGLARLLGRPAVAWALLSLDIALWHVPAAYDLTLRSDAVHYTEHATFLLFALLLWGQLIDSPPFHGRLSPPRRCGLVVATLIPQWLLALMLAFATRPWYTAYSDLRGRPGGISALTDQHLAGGVMWVPAGLPWALLVFVVLFRWIAESEEAPPAQAVRVAGSGEGAPPAHPRRSPRPSPTPSALPTPIPDVVPSVIPDVVPSVRQSSRSARDGALLAATERRPHAQRAGARK